LDKREKEKRADMGRKGDTLSSKMSDVFKELMEGRAEW
jgi:hypothetical protein